MDQTMDSSVKVRSFPVGLKAGVFLVVLGGLFFLQQLGLGARNWWALFILLPALSALWVASSLFERNRRVGYAVRGIAGGSLFILTTAFICMFGLSWAVYWPVYILVAGLNFLAFALPGLISRAGERPGFLPFQLWMLGLGLGALLLGAGFQLRQLGLVDPGLIFNRWWSLSIVLCALGGIGAALVSERGTTGHLTAVVPVAVTGLVAFLSLNWNLITPLVLIGLGLMLVFTMRR